MKDEQIVALYWNRNEAAIEETSKKYGAYLSKIAFNVLADFEDGKECVNDTYLKAWNSMPTHRPGVLSTYLGKIARQLAIDVYRKKNAFKRYGSEYALSLSELEDSFACGSTPEQVLDARLLEEAINSFLRTLSKEARNTFIGRYYFFDSLKEVAEYCNMSEAKAKSLLYRTLLIGVIAVWRMITVPAEEDDGKLLVTEDGVTIPPMEVSLSSEIAADMIGFFLYQGRCYVQYEWIYEPSDIVGEYLGTATGLIDEWTSKAGYVEYAGSVRGDFYSVKGYDPSFMLCIKDERGAVCTYICNNGITLKYGAELYEDRLHLSGNYESVQYESRASWYESLGECYELIGDNSQSDVNAVIQEFVEQIGLAEFIPCSAVPLEEGQSHMVDFEIYHLYFTMKDGTTIHLRLHENGYVRFQGLRDLCVKIPAETYDALVALLEDRVGIPVESKPDSMGTTLEDCVNDLELGSYVPSYIPADMVLERAEISYYLDQPTGKETGTEEIYLYYIGQQNLDRSLML